MLTLEVTAVRDDNGAGLLEGVESGGHDGVAEMVVVAVQERCRATRPSMLPLVG